MPAPAYLDHASTSPLRPAARAAMEPWLWSPDPGRVHSAGREARFALEDARAAVADFFGTRPRQVIFTSGGTEAIVAAVYGALASRRAGPGGGGVAVVPAVEGRAVREATQRWASSVVQVPVDRHGRIESAALAEAVSGPGVTLAHCQMANAEVGTLQPVAAAAELCRAAGALLHVDATAAAGHVPIAFDDLGADLMSISAHRFGGPQGIGALLVRRGLRIEPLIVGGDQERARRAGLENVGAAVGFGAACAELSAERAAEAAREVALTDRLATGACSVAGVSRYGPPRSSERLPHIVCLGIEGVEAEPVLIGLDQAGVAAHSGSSCSSEALEPSAVLEAMGVDAERSLRFSVGWSTTDADVDRAVEALPGVIDRLRALR